MPETIEKEMFLLLNQFWITKEEDKEAYYFLKRNQESVKNFVRKNLGNRLLIHDRFIKLEKIPAKENMGFGVASFLSPLDYVILFLFLLYLEDKPKGEKFILSSLIEYIKNTAVTLELSQVPNWNYSQDRKSLIRVLTYLQDLHVIVLKDQDTQNFQDTMEADALYETTGLSNYVVPSFDYEIYDCKNAQDFLKKEWIEQSEEKGDIRRYKVYRHLLYSPAVTKEELTSYEDDYIRKMHKVIEKEIMDSLHMEVEITKNMALVYALNTTVQKDYFPNTKKISDLVLLVNRAVLDFASTHNLEKDENECFHLSREDFDRILDDVRITKERYFSRYFLDLSFPKYQEEVLEYMKVFHFVKEEERSILCYPLMYRFLAITEKTKKKDVEQLEMVEV